MRLARNTSKSQKRPKRKGLITRLASVESLLDEERAWFSEQMSDSSKSTTFPGEMLLDEGPVTGLASFISLERAMTCLGEDRARMVQEMRSGREWDELQASSAAIESEDEEHLCAIGLDRVYCRLEKVLGIIEEVKRLCERDSQCKGVFLECKDEVLELVALLKEEDRLPTALAEKVALLYGEDGESEGEWKTQAPTDISQVD